MVSRQRLKEIEMLDMVQNDRGFMSVVLKLKKLEHFRGELPRYETAGAAGMDVRAQLREPIRLKSLERALVPTGLSVEVPPGFELQVRPRSGLAAKQGLTVLNSPGTVDADYRGEVKVILVNLSHETVEIQDQDRIAQWVICPVAQAELRVVEVLSETGRGVGGFGSTGKA